MLVEVGLMYPSPTGYGLAYPIERDDFVHEVGLLKELGLPDARALETQSWGRHIRLQLGDAVADEVLLSNVIGEPAFAIVQSNQLLREACRIARPTGSVIVRDEIGSLRAYSHLIHTRGFDIQECSPGSTRWPYMRDRYNLGLKGMIFRVALSEIAPQISKIPV